MEKEKERSKRFKKQGEKPQSRRQDKAEKERKWSVLVHNKEPLEPAKPDAKSLMLLYLRRAFINEDKAYKNKIRKPPVQQKRLIMMYWKIIGKGQ